MKSLRQFKFFFIKNFYNLKKHLGEKKYISKQKKTAFLRAQKRLK